MTSSICVRVGIVLAIAVGLPALMMGGTVVPGGTITGSTAGPTQGQDDFNTATTLSITYFTYCPWLLPAVTSAGFSANNIVFAAPGYIPQVLQGLVTPIAASDFTISNYSPWVVNNNTTTNNVIGPNGRVNGNYNRGVTGQDAGGADIMISYTPTGNDPTKVNFLQAYTQSFNGGATSAPILDVPRNPQSVYYNYAGVSGTGTTASRPGTSPLATTTSTAAWTIDIPYDYEAYKPSGACPTPEECLTRSTVTFQTFIESNYTLNNTTYFVLYGGVQWGYTYSNVDTPEPVTLVLVGCVFGLAGMRRFKVRAQGSRRA